MPIPKAFQHIENEYYRLRGLFSAGRMTPEEYERALNGLVVRDAQGRYWTMGAESGEWYVSAGDAWVRSQPPAAESSVPLRPAAQPFPSPTPTENSPLPVFPAPAVTYGGFWRRLIAYLLDGILLTILHSFVLRPLLQQAAWSIHSLLYSISFSDLFGMSLTAVASLIVTTLFSFAYFSAFWTLAGRTPGQFLLRVKVITAAGKRPGFLRSVIRCAGILIASIPLGLGLLWVALDSRKQGWHDKLARTFVIHA